MDPTQKNCPGCGTSNALDAAVCRQCGVPFVTPQHAPGSQGTVTAPGAPAAPPLVQPLTGSTAPPPYSGAPQFPQSPPPAVPPAGPAQPGAGGYTVPPTGSGAPPSFGYSGGQPPQPPPFPGQAPMQGQAPPPGQPPYAGPAQGYGAVTPPPYMQGFANPPQKKKSNTSLIIVLCIIAAVLVIGGVVLAGVFRANAAKEQAQQYNAVVESICSNTTPSKVAGGRAQLDTFSETYPSADVAELDALVEASEDYRDAGFAESRYTDMLDALEPLSGSTDKRIAGCADTLADFVGDEYDEFMAYEEEPYDDIGGGDEPATNFYPFEDDEPILISPDLAELIQDGSTLYYTFSGTNTTDKTIEYFEVWLFCYDEAGNPCRSEIDYNLEWDVYYGNSIAPGATLNLPQDYWEIAYNSNVAFAFPFVSYVEFDDGSTWGITDYTASNEDVIYYIEFIKELYDLLAPIYA